MSKSILIFFIFISSTLLQENVYPSLKYIINEPQLKDLEIGIIKYFLNNKDFSLAKNIVQTTEAINQIKLMHKPDTMQEILIVVDNSGEIVVLTLDIIKDEKIRTKMNKYEIVSTKKYNAKIDFEDNSPWSVDCRYPYIIIGSNNRTVFVYNYEEDSKLSTCLA